MSYLSLIQSFVPYVKGWEHGLSHLEYISDLLLTDNFALVTGKTRIGDQPIVEKIDLKGNLVWSTKIFWGIDNKYGDNHAQKAILLSDGSIVAGGRATRRGVETMYNPYDPFIVKLTPEGKYQWINWNNSSASTGSVGQIFEGISPEEIISVNHLTSTVGGHGFTQVSRFNEEGRLSAKLYSGFITYDSDEFIRDGSDLEISIGSISENIKDGAPIATFSICDCSNVDLQEFSFIDGVGDVDNEDFFIHENQLKIINSPDFSSKSSYSMRIRYTDPSGEYIDDSFFLNVLENQSPTVLNLSSLTLDENVKSNSVVATSSVNDPDTIDEHTYTLIPGDGDTDNSSFVIDGDQLKIVDSPDFETNSSYSIRLQATDSGGLVLGKAFTLTVNDLNEVPADLSVSTSTFDENIPGGSAVTTLSSTDPDAGDSVTYSLVTGDGDTDNNAFTIDGDQLKIVDSPDFETKASYDIRIQMKDSGDLTFEKSFELKVNDIIEYTDSDSNGLVDNSKWVQIFKDELSSVDVVSSSNGRKLREGFGWSALKAVSNDTGYQILTKGTKGKSDGKYKILSVGGGGGWNPGKSPWRTGEQMMWDGYEETFDMDLNEDSVTGVYFEDSDDNGLVDGSSTLKLVNGDQAIDIVKGGKRRPQKNAFSWSASKAIQTGFGYEVLIEGTKGKADGKFRVWSVDSDGLIQGQSAWRSGEQMMLDGYEDKFDADLNQDSITGVYFEDSDSNGLVDGSTTLKLINGDQVIDIVKGVKRHPQKNGSKWSASKVVQSETGYDVLIEGTKGKLDGKFKIWSLDTEGVVQKQSRWGSEKWLERNGYDELFGLDLSGGSEVTV